MTCAQCGGYYDEVPVTADVLAYLQECLDEIRRPPADSGTFYDVNRAESALRTAQEQLAWQVRRGCCHCAPHVRTPLGGSHL